MDVVYRYDFLRPVRFLVVSRALRFALPDPLRKLHRQMSEALHGSLLMVGIHIAVVLMKKALAVQSAFQSDNILIPAHIPATGTDISLTLLRRW